MITYHFGFLLRRVLGRLVLGRILGWSFRWLRNGHEEQDKGENPITL